MGGAGWSGRGCAVIAAAVGALLVVFFVGLPALVLLWLFNSPQ
jgi:hypothetical protein